MIITIDTQEPPAAITAAGAVTPEPAEVQVDHGPETPPPVLILDIETAPMSEEFLRGIYTPPQDDEIKTGNTKDPEKLAALREEKRLTHCAKFIADAALSPNTGKVCGVAMRLFVSDASLTSLLVEDERSIVKRAIEEILSVLNDPRGRIMTYNGHDFDLPFLLRRAWFLGIRFDLSKFRRGRYWREQFIDLRELVMLGQREYHTGGLAGLGRLLGCEHEKSEASGKGFHLLLQSDPERAKRYMASDLDLTEECARRLGVTFPRGKEQP